MADSAVPSAGRVFISYRREETAWQAVLLFDRLADRYGRGQIFKDIDSIQLGDDFVEVITAAVGSCDVLLALIGEQWLTITNEHGRARLEDPDDFVRLEIEAALTRNVRVIPILVAGARMPRPDQLPPSLAKLVRRQALELSPSHFESDTNRLHKVLDSTLAEVHAQPTITKPDLPVATRLSRLDPAASDPDGLATQAQHAIDDKKYAEEQARRDAEEPARRDAEEQLRPEAQRKARIPTRRRVGKAILSAASRPSKRRRRYVISVAIAALLTVGGITLFVTTLKRHPKVATNSYTVLVYSKVRWNSTPLTLKGGETVRFVATGEISDDITRPDQYFPPDGATRDATIDVHNKDPYLQFPHAALVGRIGNGTPFYIGRALQISGTDVAAGGLSLGVNDSVLSDNTGAFSVRIEEHAS
jgi:hypothetical protein